jgi:Mrp family chromosome partitioning ATPase
MSRPTAASAEPSRFEPTVFGAVRRYSTLVVAVTLAAVVIAVGYTLLQPKIYRAQAAITVPQPVTLQTPQGDPGQYLDSQALLLQSQGVARQAADIANDTLGGSTLTPGDFSAVDGSLAVSPPTTATAGSYGASIIGVSFKGPDVRIAQVGLDSLLQAYSAARIAAVRAQTDTAILGINHAIASINALMASISRQLATASLSLPPDNQSALRKERQLLVRQLTGLETARTQAVANEQAAVAQRPTVDMQPTALANHRLARAGAIGLVLGVLIGGALAFLLASRRRGIADRQDPAALYRVPLIGEIPAFEADRTWRPGGTSADGTLPVIDDPQPAVAEAFRFAAGSVERIRATRGPRLSLVFVSPLAGSGKSTTVANMALAVAEGGTRVLAVDADGDLTAQLLPGAPVAEGFEQVLAGQRSLGDSIQMSPVKDEVAVLGSAPAPWRVTGAARLQAVRDLLAEAKASYDLVLIDSPALLQVASATEVVEAADAAIIVPSPHELIEDHIEMVDRLNLLGSDVIGYIYSQAPVRPHLGRYPRNGSPSRPAGPQTTRVALPDRIRPSSWPPPP